MSTNCSPEEFSLQCNPIENHNPQIVHLKSYHLNVRTHEESWSEIDHLKKCLSNMSHLKNHLDQVFIKRIVTPCDPPEKSLSQVVNLKNCHCNVIHRKVFFWRIVTQIWLVQRIISPNYSSEELSLKSDPPEESSPQIVLLKNCHSKETHLKNHLPKLFFWRIVTQKWPT